MPDFSRDNRDYYISLAISALLGLLILCVLYFLTKKVIPNEVSLLLIPTHTASTQPFRVFLLIITSGES